MSLAVFREHEILGPRLFAFELPRKIFPSRIRFHDQGVLFCPLPTLELLFALNRYLDAIEHLEIKQLRRMILRAEGAFLLLAMLPQPLAKIAGDANIERLSIL